MSKYFVLGEDGIGPGGQIYFRKCHPEYKWYDIYLDDIKIGKVMEHRIRTRVSWAGLSIAEDSEWFKTRQLDGFATRLDAATFVIKHHGYWMQRERESEDNRSLFFKYVMKARMKRGYEIIKGMEI